MRLWGSDAALEVRSGDGDDRDVRPAWRAEVVHGLVAITALGGVTAVYVSWLHVTNPTTAALSYLLIVLFVAASSRLRVAGVTSAAAALFLDFFFLPPIHSLSINDPQDWLAFFAFMAVSLVASHLSFIARARAHELDRLFDFSRDVLLATDSSDEAGSLAHHISRRFGLDYVAICFPTDSGFERHEAGTAAPASALESEDLRRVVSNIDGTSEGRWRPHGKELVLASGERHPLWFVPLRHRTHAIGVLAVAGRAIEPSTLDALAGVVAIAIERADLLEQRQQAEISQRSVELKSALLASLAHNLHTPLTAIRMAVNNLSAPSLTDIQRSNQVDTALTGLDRLTRLFQNMLELGRIDVGGITLSPRWVHPSEVIEAARGQVDHALREHGLNVVDGSNGRAVHVDARLLATALAHLLETRRSIPPKDPRSP